MKYSLIISNKKLEKEFSNDEDLELFFHFLIWHYYFCKYRSKKNASQFAQFIDYIIKSISSINVFKDKMSAFDIQSYKTNLDKIIKSYKTEFDRYMSSSKNLVSDTFVVFDNKVAALFKTFEDKLENEKNLIISNRFKHVSLNPFSVFL